MLQRINLRREITKNICSSLSVKNNHWAALSVTGQYDGGNSFGRPSVVMLPFAANT